MSQLSENNTLMLVVDIQEKLLNAVFNKEDLLKNSIIMTMHTII